MGCYGICGSSKDAARASTSTTENAATKKSTYDTCKDYSLKAVAVIAVLGAIFAFLNASGVVMDPSLMYNAIVGYTVGGACTLLALGILFRDQIANLSTCCKAKDADGDED